MKKTLLAVLLGSFALASFAQPITIEKQGAFSAGGTVIEAKKTFQECFFDVPARRRSVHAYLADNTGWERRLPERVPA